METTSILMYLLVLVMVTVASVQARTYNNPIVRDISRFRLGAAHQNGTYFAVFKTKSTIQIYASTDLKNWTDEGNLYTTCPNYNTLTRPKIQESVFSNLIYSFAYNNSRSLDDDGGSSTRRTIQFKPIKWPILFVPNNEADNPSINKNKANLMMHLLALVLITEASDQARTFNNPILGDKPSDYPGAIKVNETYYVAAHTSDITLGILPIHSSTDLISWNKAGYVFDATNTPTWPSNVTLRDPKIHKIGSNYLVYFSARTSSSHTRGFGAAIASHPLGPYTPIDRPIMFLFENNAENPSIMNDKGKLYLVWGESQKRGTNVINARQLNPNGLSFASEQKIKLLTPSLTWERGYIDSPWYIRRGSYHYILYTGAYCSVGVARSSLALGPYEKLPNPILVGNSKYECTGYPSVVKDLDDEGHLIFFTASQKNDANHELFVLLASVSWNADDWPYVEEF